MTSLSEQNRIKSQLKIFQKKSVIIPVIDTNTRTPIMKQPRGLKYKVNKVLDTVPSYITRDTTL